MKVCVHTCTHIHMNTRKNGQLKVPTRVKREGVCFKKKLSWSYMPLGKVSVKNNNAEVALNAFILGGKWEGKKEGGVLPWWHSG